MSTAPTEDAGIPLRRGDALALPKEPHAVNMLENDLLLASRMRSLAHVCRALTHDLKAPLNAMQLTLELMDEPTLADVSEGGRRRCQHYVQILKQELARLNRMLQTVLDQKEPLASAPAAFDLAGLLHEVYALLAPQARRQRVALVARVPEEEAATVIGYRDRVKQALLNIAINGMEATRGGGTLIIEMLVRDSSAEVAISDSGTGIPQALLDEIYTLHFTTKKSASGIGLYVARRVVESHGGEIAVDSKEGCGTCFRIKLPVCMR